MSNKVSKAHFFSGTIICLCLTFLSGVAVKFCHAETITIKVASYNIRHAQGMDGRVDIERIAKVLKNSAADLICLQEVDRGVPRSNGVDQAAYLAEKLAMNYFYAPAIPLHQGHYGNAILASHQIGKSYSIKLPSRRENRIAAIARIDLPSEQSLNMICTHLPLNEHEQLQAVDIIVNSLPPGGNNIIAGDFNQVVDSPVLRALGVHFTLDETPPVKSFPSDNPLKQIDYILISRRSPLRMHKVYDRHLQGGCRDAGPCQSVPASDHLMIVANISAHYLAIPNLF